MVDNAAAPKPAPVCHRNSRRTRPQKSRFFMTDSLSLVELDIENLFDSSVLLDVQELVQVEGH